MGSSKQQQGKIQDSEQFRDKIATVDDHGKRLWIYPKQPKGRFYKWRSYVSYVLLSVLVITPFITIGGDPIFLFNVLERRFILFGINFMPQDFHLFVLVMLSLIVFIVLFTVIWGRLFCGWICPQTIFMEMVFRKIEYWIEGDANAQRRLQKAPWDSKKLFKKGLKQSLFFLISVLVANIFLAYIIGLDEVLRIVSEPVHQHYSGFSTMLIFSGVFYFVFSYLREQVCVAICPYGRLQGVLLDAHSIVVHYDHLRGEPRSKIRKNSTFLSRNKNPLGAISKSLNQAQQDLATNKKDSFGAEPDSVTQAPLQLGDCIDCKLCIQVCPTGIDIREGTQMECINCTACIDACDEVMNKVGRDPGLVRYDSYEGILGRKSKLLTTRVKAYTLILVLLLVFNAFLLRGRQEVESILLRTPGTLYYPVENDLTKVKNLYNYQIINKTDHSFPIELKLMSHQGEIQWIGKKPVTKSRGITEGALFITLDKNDLDGQKTRLKVAVISQDRQISTLKTNFLGPMR